MFSRFVLQSTAPELSAAFEVELNEISELNPNFNAAPGDLLPVILMGSARQVRLTSGIWTSVTESRHAFETSDLEKNATLQKAILRKRCIIPLNGYYEWKRLSETINIPFYLRILNRPILGIAGVYAQISDPDGTEILQFTPFQTRANELIEPLTAKMPAILEPSQWATWIDPMISDVARITDLIRPADTYNMASYRISGDVNDRTRNDANLLKPVM